MKHSFSIGMVLVFVGAAYASSRWPQDEYRALPGAGHILGDLTLLAKAPPAVAPLFSAAPEIRFLTLATKNLKFDTKRAAAPSFQLVPAGLPLSTDVIDAPMRIFYRRDLPKAAPAP